MIRAHRLNILRLTNAVNEYNHRMRLLFVTDARSPISQNWIRYFAKRERSDEIYIASTFQCELDFPVKRLEFTPVAFSAANKQTSLPGSAALRKLRAFIREVQPDIVHAMRVPYEGMLTASAMKGVSRPPKFIVSTWGNDFTLHAPSTPLMKYYTRLTMSKVNALHADTERDVRLAREWGLSEGQSTLVVPGNGGVRSDVFYQPKKPVKNPVIINPRGVRPYVRNDSFFKAIPLVLAKRSDARFLRRSMQGAGEVLQWIRELTIEHAV